MDYKIEKQWYVVNTYSGHENKVKENLEKRIETQNLTDYIFRVVVAEHEVEVLKDGKPTGKTKTKNMYPGYIFIEMIMTDEAWYVVRNTPGVTGFTGSSGGHAKPFPVAREQIEPVLKKIGMFDAEMYSNYEVNDLDELILDLDNIEENVKELEELITQMALEYEKEIEVLRNE